MTGMMVRYKIINLSWLLTGEDLVSHSSGNFKTDSFMDWEPLKIGQELRCETEREKHYYFTLSFHKLFFTRPFWHPQTDFMELGM